MISPYVRRKRLARELRGLREAAGMTHEDLGRAIGRNRTKISRLENGRIRPDQAEVMKILDVLEVSGDRWVQLVTIAREAAEKGWWESYGNDQMGGRQALFADLEAGASSIREYQQPFVPGLLQTPEFTRALLAAEGAAAAGVKPDRVVEARAARQRMLRRPDGPTYEVILDEVVVRRLAAPAPVMCAQLDHLVEVADNEEKITIRVLPVDAVIDGYRVPQSAFSIYEFADPGDPTMVAVGTVTSDLVVDESDDVARYTEIYDCVRDSALSVTDSIAALTHAAQTLRTGRYYSRGLIVG
jgi:transcriptional regulator with XRE-family HTH domain